MSIVAWKVQMLPRWHIEPLFVARGKYKNIINTFTENSFTEEHREATEGILKGFTAQMLKDIALDRNISQEQVSQLVLKSHSA